MSSHDSSYVSFGPEPSADRNHFIRSLKTLSNEDIQDESWQRATYISPDNATRLKISQYLCQQFARMQGKVIFKWFNSTAVTLLPSRLELVRQHFPELSSYACEGMPLYATSNMNVQAGICNGASGCIKAIIPDDDDMAAVTTALENALPGQVIILKHTGT
eukprot:GHVH01016272.1.p1 GENE.GHVH01016272.1~~GHVH01016272.1.p1  ORF type:complete len:161 (-),score=8.47 GHVH01016272.1:67-549(-)